MRVTVMVEQLLAPVPGGVGRYTAELAAALARAATPSDVVSSATAWHRDLSRARVVGVAGPHRLAAPRRALIAMWQRGVGPAPTAADLVHAPSLLVPPVRRARVVVTIHDAVPWTHPQTLTPRGVRWHRAMAERVVGSDAVVTVPTAAVARELLEALPGLTSDRVRVLGGGVSAALSAPVDRARAERARARLALPERYVLTLATLEPRKGLGVLVSAIARLGAAAPAVLVVGQAGWGGVDVVDAARAAGLAPGAVRALGRLDDEELAVVLRSASVLVAPSLAEGFGLPVAEAMAVGTPVICTDVAALVEVAGGAALVVGRGDSDALAGAIEAVLSDERLAAGLAAAGLARAVEHTWDAVAARAWLLYRELAPAAGR